MVFEKGAGMEPDSTIFGTIINASVPFRLSCPNVWRIYVDLWWTAKNVIIAILDAGKRSIISYLIERKCATAGWFVEMSWRGTPTQKYQHDTHTRNLVSRRGRLGRWSLCWMDDQQRAGPGRACGRQVGNVLGLAPISHIYTYIQLYIQTYSRWTVIKVNCLITSHLSIMVSFVRVRVRTFMATALGGGSESILRAEKFNASPPKGCLLFIIHTHSHILL